MSHRLHLVLASVITCLGYFGSVDKANAVAKFDAFEQTVIAQTDPYQNALKIAQKATAGGKVATTSQQWADLADQWQQAADLMAKVPASHQNFDSAQSRLATYTQNSLIASNQENKSRQLAQASPLTNSLSVGSTGTQVKQLQQNLKDLGYFKANVDGVFTEATANAVAAFQKAQGLESDGVVGQTTWTRLQSVIASKPKPAESPKPEQPKKSNWSKRTLVRWILVGLVGVTGLAGTVLLLLKLLNRPADEEDEEENEEGEEFEEFPPQLPMGEHAETPDVEFPPRSVEANGRGFINSPTHLEAEEQPPILESPKPKSDYGAPVPESTVSESTASEVHGEMLAVGEMTRLAKINIVDELIRDLDSPDVGKRRKAIWELGQRGNSQAAGPLINLLIDSDSQQRSLILAALSEIGVQTLKPMNRALSISLQDDNPEVRKNAIRDLTRIYELMAHVSQLMRHAAEDPDKEVRETAKWALNQLGRIRTLSSGFEGNFEKESSRENFNRYSDEDDYR